MKNNKFVSNNYYVSPYPEEHLEKLQKRNIICAAAAFVLYLPILILAIYPGIRCAFWLTEAYEGVFALAALCIVSGGALLFCNINNFYGYKLRKEVKQKDAPFLGFRKMSYNGQFFTAVLLSALVVFYLVIFIGGNIAESVGYFDKLLDKNSKLTVSGSLGTDIAVLIFTLLSAAAAWVYYILAHRANKDMQYVRVDELPKKSKKRGSERKHLPAFMLTKEEVDEASAHEFEQDDEDEETPEVESRNEDGQ